MIAANEGGKYEELTINRTSRFRRILPQIIAASVKSLHTVDYGLMLAMPTIIIPALTGIPNDQNRNEFLTMNGNQTSWIGTMLFIKFSIEIHHKHIEMCLIRLILFRSEYRFVDSNSW